ncbi:MAG TPA: hypothetical protein VOA41_06725 [Candidatus Dormibacteraeota bacterium]|nr:hypothetical protein [Candidatus Dormibacteraeota bacterium]
MPKYDEGDLIRVEFLDEATGIAKLMWVRVHRCNDALQVVFGTIDAPASDASGKLKLGAELAVRFLQIRDHKKQMGLNTNN